jgi:perosamine synthetase
MSKYDKIQVHQPDIGEDEIASVVAALRRGEISGSFGKAIPEFEEKFAAYCGCKYGVSVTSGTTALQLAASAAGIGQGDEVLMSASTNIATALAAYHNNAVSVGVDSEADTWNIDPDLIEPLITPRSRAIIPVHLFGHPARMDKIMEIAHRHNLLVIEDCAESHGATWKGKMTGGFGDMGCFSFYVNKVITTGEGGMVVTNDAKLAERLRLLRNLAFTKPRFLHELPGYNFRMTGYQAAMGLAQFARIDQIIAQKRRVAHTYNRHLKDVAGLQLPIELPEARNVYWMYAITVGPEFGITRDQLAQTLAAQGIETRTFFCPMNRQPFLKRQAGFREIPCPVADRIWESGLYLPSANQLEEDAIAYIAGAVRAAARPR